MNVLDASQEQAVQRALALDGFALFFEPRVGKTRTALEIANRRPDIHTLIVMCPKGTFDVWAEAIRTEYSGAAKEIHVANFEQFKSAKMRRHYRKLAESNVSMVIVDEAHKLKNRRSKQSRGIRTLCYLVHRKVRRFLAKYRLVLTGTPIEKSRENVWALYDFIDPEIFGPWRKFRENFLVYGGFKGRQIIGTKNNQLYDKIYHEYCARVRLTEVSERPLKIVRRVELIDWPRRARRLYDKLEEKLIVQTRKVKVRAPLMITLILRLQQLCGGWLTDGEESEHIHNAKLLKLYELIPKSIPCLIACRYVHEIEHIREFLSGAYSVIVVKGGEPLREARPEVDIVIIQTSAGVGIDLSFAKTVLFYSWDYSYINLEQMRFRILSRTQTFARYIFLVMRDSTDEIIYQAAVKKRKLSDVINDKYRSSK